RRRLRGGGPARPHPQTQRRRCSGWDHTGRDRRGERAMNSTRRRKADQKFVMISVVAERYAIHPQTLRLYEREGLIKPRRNAGNTRLYDEEAVRRLEIILTLTRDLGVDLAGVEVILHMREQMEKMQGEVDRLLEF